MNLQNDKDFTGYPSIDKPWISRYPSDLIFNRKIYSNINEAIHKVWENETETIIDYYGTQITVKDLFDAVSCVSTALSLYGIKEGDSVVVSLESVPEFIELLLACERLGVTLKSYIGEAADIVALLNSSSSKLYFTHDYLSEADAQKIYSDTSVRHIITINPLHSANKSFKIRSNIMSSIKEHYPNCSTSDPKNITWKAFLDVKPCEFHFDNNTKANILFSAFTSGTTGTPKEVLHTSESILGIVNQLILSHSNKNERDTWLLAILPPTLVAVVVSMMLYPIIDGKRLILDPYAKIEDLDIEMMFYEPNCWGMVPAFFNSLLKSSRIPENYDMNYFNLIGFGAELVSKRFITRVESFLKLHNCKAPLSAGYGQSEGGSDFTICIGHDMLMSGSAGMPLIDTTISIFTPGTTSELQYTQIGEICKCGPGLMLGYRNSKNESVLIKHSDEKIWLHTGDYGFMTKEGLLFVLGRNKINVYPDKSVFAVTVENKLSDIKGVEDLVIVAGKDTIHDGFEVPYLFIIPENNHNIQNILNDLNELILKELMPEEMPVKIFVIDKKPIKRFKTDIRSLQEKYNLV